MRSTDFKITLPFDMDDRFDWIIDCEDFKLKQEKEIHTCRLEKVWKLFLQKLPEDLKQEAQRRTWNLMPIEGEGMASLLDYTLKFDIQDASPALRKYTENPDSWIICMKDPL